MLDARGQKASFGSGIPRTWLLINKREYKNSAFELYTLTPAKSILGQGHWTNSKTVPNPIRPDYINIFEGQDVEIETTDFFKSDPLKDIKVYYCKLTNPTKALIIGFVKESDKKTYHLITAINQGKSKLKMSELPTINESQILDKLYEENYKRNKSLTIIMEKTIQYYNVDSIIYESGTEKFQKYIHKPSSKVTDYTNLVLDSNSECTFKNFKSSEYTNDNLQHVAVYYHKNDSHNTLPILIEIIPKHGKKFGESGVGTSSYYKLQSLNEKKKKDEEIEWSRTYEKDQSGTNDVSSILNTIYSGALKDKIDKIVGIGDNSTLIGAVSGSVTTIGAVTGVGGFLIYKNAALVITFFKSLF